MVGDAPTLGVDLGGPQGSCLCLTDSDVGTARAGPPPLPTVDSVVPRLLGSTNGPHVPVLREKLVSRNRAPCPGRVRMDLMLSFR